MAFSAGILGFSICGGAAAFDIRPSARVHLDYASHESDVQPLRDGWSMRRATVGLEGRFDRNLPFEISYELASKGDVRPNDGKFKDVTVAYTGWNAGDVTLGQFKVPFSLEGLTGSDDTSFIERALPTEAFTPSRRLGLGFSRQRETYTASAMVFGSAMGGDERGHGAAARVTVAPVHSVDTLVHLGLAAVTEKPRRRVRFDSAPEARVARVELVNTGRISDVSRIHRAGLEGAWRTGPFSVQTEWMKAHVQRDVGGSGVDLNGWYAAGSWLLTGESRPYRNGRFRRIVPGRFAGAWELTARYSRIDLDDGQVRGGRERNVTVGLNYHLNERLRLMLNYIRARSEYRGEKDEPDILLMRLQLSL